MRIFGDLEVEHKSRTLLNGLRQGELVAEMKAFDVVETRGRQAIRALQQEQRSKNRGASPAKTIDTEFVLAHRVRLQKQALAAQVAIHLCEMMSKDKTTQICEAQADRSDAETKLTELTELRKERPRQQSQRSACSMNARHMDQERALLMEIKARNVELESCEEEMEKIASHLKRAKGEYNRILQFEHLGVVFDEDGIGRAAAEFAESAYKDFALSASDDEVGAAQAESRSADAAGRMVVAGQARGHATETLDAEHFDIGGLSEPGTLSELGSAWDVLSMA